jgi:ppGpp synthetase/RelA/SpoT-type nucleotidyltranferase
MATVALDKTALLAQYTSSQPLYERLQDEVEFILNEQLKNAKIPIHAIEHRIKNFDSIIKKAERFELADPINQLNDVLGFRVICLFLSDLDRIFALLRKNFKIIVIDDKRVTKGENVFGYLSVHLIATLPPSHKGPRYDGLKSLRFEIQVRTISMHAWSIISHYLDYKTPNAVPSELKRDFNALSGLFYIADQHFEMFFKSSKISRKKATTAVERPKGGSDTEINFDTLSAYLKKEFPQRQHADAEGISSLIEQLNKAGIKSINVLDEKLKLGADAFAAYEKKNPPFEMRAGKVIQGTKFQDVGVGRITLQIVDKAFRNLLGSKTPEQFDEFKPLVKAKQP